MASIAARPITVGIVSRTFYYTPLWLALEQGLFAARGLDVATTLTGHADQAALLRSGRCDLTIAPPDGVLQDVDRGGSTMLLAGNSARLSHCLIVQPEIERFEQLRGKRIGILSRTEGSFFHFQQLAAAHGMRFPEEFVAVETGGAPLRHELLLARSIDAGLQSFPWVDAAHASGLRKLLDISDYVPLWQFNTINGERRWCEAHGDAVQRFLQVLAEATELFYNDPQAACDVAARNMGLPLALARSAWDYFVATGCLTRDLAIECAALEKVHAALRAAGLMQQGPVFDAGRYVAQGAPLR